MTGILATRDIPGAAGPHGATSLVNPYAAMPSPHVAWAAWCATAIVITTRSRWQHLAWPCPAATTLAGLAPASHFLLDAAAVDSSGTQKIMSPEVREDVSRSRPEPAASARAGA